MISKTPSHRPASIAQPEPAASAEQPAIGPRAPATEHPGTVERLPPGKTLYLQPRGGDAAPTQRSPEWQRFIARKSEGATGRSASQAFLTAQLSGTAAAPIRNDSWALTRAATQLMAHGTGKATPEMTAQVRAMADAVRHPIPAGLALGPAATPHAIDGFNQSSDLQRHE